MIVMFSNLVSNSVQQIFVLQCYIIAATTILYYDHIVTFPAEVQLIWRKRLSFGGIIFLLNRYVTSIGYIIVMYMSFNPPNDITLCRNIARLSGYTTLLTQLVIALTLLIRTYALYNRSIKILSFIALLGVSSIVTSAYSLTQFYGILLSFGLGSGLSSEAMFRTCLPGFIKSSAPFKVSILLSFIFDTVIFLLTINRTLQIMGEHRRSGLRSPLRLYNLLMRDGSIYFAVMLVVNLVNFVLFSAKSETLMDTFYAQSTGNNSIMTHIISVTMISRIILNLYSVDKQRNTGRSLQQESVVLNVGTWIARAADGFETEYELESENHALGETGQQQNPDGLD